MGNCECSDSKYCGDNQSASVHEILTKGSLYDEQKEREETQELLLKVRTWQKESYSLFDYENQSHLHEQSIQVTTNGLLVRRINDIYWVDHQEFHKQSDDVLLFGIACEGGRYRIINNMQIRQTVIKEQFEDDENKREQTTKYHNTKRSQHQLDDEQHSFEEDMREPSFQSQQQILQQQIPQAKLGQLRSLRQDSIARVTGSNGVRLMCGDVLKMGRVKFKIREINFKTFAKSSSMQQRNFSLSRRRLSSASSQSQEGASQCRVCLGTSVSDQNPLVNPCRCAGTMKYIHLECLQKWLRQKLQSHLNENCLIYMWKSLECELCKFNYPPVFKSDDAIFDLVELSKPKDMAYMLLEISQKKYEENAQPSREDRGPNGKSNGVYIITFGDKKELRIGRAHETEVRINDISVSRQHATFKLVTFLLKDHKVDGEVYLNDTKSKFGTLILMNRSFQLHEQLNGIEMQVSRSVVLFQIGKPEIQHNITYQEFEYDIIFLNSRQLVGRGQQHYESRSSDLE